MKIVVFEAKPRDKKFFSKVFKSDKLVFVPEPLSEDNVSKYKSAEVVCTFIFSTVNKRVIDSLPKLKLVATRSTGFDHVDVRYAKKKGVFVSNVPAYGDNTVAEHTFALILNLSRNVHKSYVRALNDNYRIDDLTGFDLKGKWLGVIGVGHIGLHVIKIAKGFGMHVVAYDKHRNSFIADLLHFNYVDSVDDVLRKADIITLHVPATPETVHMINKDNLKLVKRGALLINTSRGSVVDTDALYDALKSGRLGGAGLDVIEGEQFVKEDKALLSLHDPDKMRTLIEDKEILKMDNVVFTPHNAFNSVEALHRILETTADNIISFSRGSPINVVY